MTLLERIEADRDAARREGRKDDSAFYSYLIAKAREPGKAAGNSTSTDDQVVQVVQKLIRENDETLTTAPGQGEERLRRQNKLLTTYLPNQLDEGRLAEIITTIIDASGQPKSKRLLGKIMSVLKMSYPGQYTPALASQIATRLLEEPDDGRSE